ncbi:MAG: mechanosensitive ion channel family protein, partial [Anaerolineales bacterium]|nr:mechanosensitive ion channel family protein [Anaerolineales bacterium]
LDFDMLQKELLEKIRAEQTLKHKDDILKLTNKFIDTITLDAERLRQGWIEKIRAGQALKEEDDILKLIDDSVVISKLSPLEISRSQDVTAAYKRVMAKSRKAKAEEVPWLQISSLFYKLALICKQRTNNEEKRWGEWELSVREQYQKLRRIIRQDTNDAAYRSIVIPLLFLIIFTILNLLWNFWSGDTLGKQLAFWRTPVLLIGAAFFANGIVHVFLASLAHWVTEKTWTELDDVIVSAIIGPLSALATAIFLVNALDILTGPASAPLEFGPFLTWVTFKATATISRTLVVVLVSTWFSVFILNRVLVWSMEQWAKRTTQIYDDMFVQMVKIFGTFILLAIGIGAALAVFNGPLSEATGVDNIILPYTIIVSVFTAIAGFAASAGFENFFGGLLLQIEKPFDRGERIILTDGQICDVRDIGMRSTVLYNVTEHTEVSVPNSEMAKMTIKNSSRPDLELRIAVPAWIAPGVRNLKIAGAILLDIAYLEREIDQMRVFEAELKLNERDKMKENQIISSYRTTIEESMERLVKRHVKIRKTIVSRIIGGGVSEPEPVFDADGNTEKDPWRKVLKSIEDLRRNYGNALKDEEERLLRCVRDLEGDQADEMLRNYRRAINDVVISEHNSSPEEINNMLREVALREYVDEKKLCGVLLLLSEAESTKTNVDQYILDKIQKKLREFESRRLGIVLRISDEVASLQNYIYAIGEQYADVRPELDGIIGELAKEPSVSSEYSDDGHIRITLSCYVLYLERRLEIQHKINRDIEWRFNSAEIKFERSAQKEKV